MTQTKVNQAGFAATIVLVVLAVVVIGGAGYYVYQRNQTESANLSTAPVAEHLPAHLDGLKSLQDIRPLAETEADGTDIVSAELEQQDGQPVYMFKLANGRVLLYDAKTGGQLTDRKTTVGQDAEVLPDQFVPSITMAEAMATAKEQLPGKDVTKISLQNEQRVVVYSVRFAQGGRVDVNAKTGQLVKVIKGSDSGNSQAPKQTSDDTGQPTDDSDSTGDDSTSTSQPDTRRTDPVGGGGGAR